MWPHLDLRTEVCDWIMWFSGQVVPLSLACSFGQSGLSPFLPLTHVLTYLRQDSAKASPPPGSPPDSLQVESGALLIAIPVSFLLHRLLL